MTQFVSQSGFKMLPLVLILLFSGHISGKEESFKALSFGKSTADYIQFTPDMSPFQSSFTSCMWIKRHDAGYPIVLHYYREGDSIILGSNGYFNWVQSVHLPLTERFPEKNQWFHYCLSWHAGGRQRVYINGEEVGSASASSSSLPMGGEICIGQHAHSSKSSGYTFGGELFKLNLYSEVLSPSQIRAMSEAGLCSPIETQYESRTLRWEQILTEPRYGNVREFVPGECVSECISFLTTELNKTKVQLRETQERLEDRETRLNKSESEVEQLSTALSQTVTELEESRIQLNKSESEVEQLSTALSQTVTELEESRLQLNNCRDEVQEIESVLLKTRETLNETVQELSGVSGTLNSTQSELSAVRTHLNSTQSELSATRTHLNSTQSELSATRTRLREMERALRESESKLNESLSELEAGRKVHEISRWDVLLTAPYFNNLFSRQLYEQLTGSWNMMEKFIGVNITFGFVEHFREFHEEHEQADEHDMS